MKFFITKIAACFSRYAVLRGNVSSLHRVSFQTKPDQLLNEENRKEWSQYNEVTFNSFRSPRVFESPQPVEGKSCVEGRKEGRCRRRSGHTSLGSPGKSHYRRITLNIEATSFLHLSNHHLWLWSSRDVHQALAVTSPDHRHKLTSNILSHN